MWENGEVHLEDHDEEEVYVGHLHRRKPSTWAPRMYNMMRRKACARQCIRCSSGFARRDAESRWVRVEGLLYRFGCLAELFAEKPSECRLALNCLMLRTHLGTKLIIVYLDVVTSLVANLASDWTGRQTSASRPPSGFLHCFFADH